MSEKLVVLYGNDQGANNVLDLVEKSAKEQGFQTLRIPGFKAVISDEHIAVALRADAVVLGVSGDVPEAKFAHYLLAKEPDMDGRMVFLKTSRHQTATKIRFSEASAESRISALYFRRPKTAASCLFTAGCMLSDTPTTGCRRLKTSLSGLRRENLALSANVGADIQEAVL